MDHKDICRLLIAALEDEHTAESEYSEIIALMPEAHKEHIQVLEAIKENEREHFELLKEMVKGMNCQELVKDDDETMEKLIALSIITPIV